MRGVFAFVFLVVIATAFLSFSQRKPQDLTQAIAVEKLYYLDSGFQSALRQSLLSEEPAQSLPSLEGFFEANALSQGISADLWFGFVSDTDLESVKKRMLAEKKALKPVNSFDFSTVFEGLPALLAILEQREYGWVISSSGLALFSKESSGFFKPFGRRPAFGASFYYAELAYLSVAGEGFR